MMALEEAAAAADYLAALEDQFSMLELQTVGSAKVGVEVAEVTSS
jgi:hypothetical protein